MALQIGSGEESSARKSDPLVTLVKKKSYPVELKEKLRKKKNGEGRSCMTTSLRRARLPRKQQLQNKLVKRTTLPLS